MTVDEVALDNTDVSADCSTVLLESCSSITYIPVISTVNYNEALYANLIITSDKDVTYYMTFVCLLVTLCKNYCLVC